MLLTQIMHGRMYIQVSIIVIHVRLHTYMYATTCIYHNIIHVYHICLSRDVDRSADDEYVLHAVPWLPELAATV